MYQVIMITIIPERIVLVAEKGPTNPINMVTEPDLNHPLKVLGKA
jgi:hypothetical protein